jgi:hypothetical protein
MATPITHVVLAAKIFDNIFKDKIKKDFFIGSLFPDIRYLKVIDRDKSHFENLKLKDLKNDDSFMAGVKFHSIVDIARGKFIVDSNVYSLCPKSKYIAQSLKVLEDEIFYEQVKDWSEYSSYLNEIIPQEKEYGIAENDIRRWHDILQQYFQKQPDEKAVTAFAVNIGFSKQVAGELNENIAKMKANKQIINILKNLYNNFDALIS